jgi:hypothetical protein
MRKYNLLFPQSSCFAPLAYFNPGKLYCKSSLRATLKLVVKAFKYQRLYFSSVFLAVPRRRYYKTGLGIGETRGFLSASACNYGTYK